MLTPQEVKDQIMEHSPERRHAMENRDLYMGKLPIYYDKKHDGRSKIGTRFATSFVDKFTGYFAGKPTTIQHKTSDKIQEHFDDIAFDNDLPYIQRQLTVEAAMTGTVFLMIYQNEKKENRWLILRRENVIFVRNATTEEVEYAIRYYYLKEGHKDVLVAQVYDTEGNIYHYIETEAGLVVDYDENKPNTHRLGGIPIVEFPFNRHKTSLIDMIKDHARTFDKILSFAADENVDIRNIYAVVTTSLGLSEGDLEKMLGSRIVELTQGDKLEFISKDAKTEPMERFLDRLLKLMFEIAQIVDMSDDSFTSAQSGVALMLKTFNMNNRAVVVEDEFKRGFRQLLRVIEPAIAAKMKDKSILIDNPNRQPIYKIREWDIQFERNLPLTMVGTTQDLVNLKNMDILDDETLLSLMDFVNDPMAIIEKKEIQDREKMGLDYTDLHFEE